MKSTRTYGIEIEAYNVTHSTILRALRAVGIQVEDEGYSHRTTPHWKIVTDCSLSGPNTFEIVSPILTGDAGLAQLKTVCDVLKQVGAKVNTSCGLHVHVNGRDFNNSLTKVKNLARMWFKYETCFDQIVAPSRRGNCMTKSNLALHGGSVDASFKEISKATRLSQVMIATNEFADSCTGRYRKLNLCALLRHGTVEFRQHGGTIDYEKISNWVELLTDFADEAAAAVCISSKGAGDFDRLLRNASNPEVRKYLKARRVFFNSSAAVGT